MIQPEDEKTNLIIAFEPLDGLYVETSCSPSYLRTECEDVKLGYRQRDSGWIKDRTAGQEGDSPQSV